MIDEKKKYSYRLNKRVSQLAELVMLEYHLSELDAIKLVYESDLYRLLADEKTKLWWLSSPALLEILRVEKETGDINNSSYLFEMAG